MQLKWSEAELTPGDYSAGFKKIDGLVAKAVAAHKQVSLTLYILSDLAPYISSMPGVVIYQTANGSMVLPWDSIVEPRIRAFIQAICAHYDGVVDYLVMGGLGFRTETYMPLPGELTPQPPFSDAQWAAMWETQCENYIDVYGANLTKTPFIVAGGNPFKGNTVDGQASFMRVFNYGLIYQGFGVMQWGLKAASDDAFWINGLVKEYGPFRASGFQATGTATIPVGGTGHVGGDVGGTLEQMLNAGEALNADYIEIYPADALDSASQAVIDAANKKMLAIP